jgi:hypothetical protein
MALKRLVVNLQSICISLDEDEEDLTISQALNQGDFHNIETEVLEAINQAFKRGEAPIESVEELD